MKNLIFFATLLFLLSCNDTKKVDTQAEGEKIMQASKDWSQAAAAGDVDRIVSYWADDAILINAGQPILKGKDEIRKMVEESFKMPGFSITWQPQSVVVSESGDMGYLIEDSQMSIPDSTGQTFTIKNTAVTIWRKSADGTWKNAVDIATPKPAGNN